MALGTPVPTQLLPTTSSVAADDYLVVIKDGVFYKATVAVVFAAGWLGNHVTEAQLTDSDAAINTDGKFLGKLVFDTTNSQMLFAAGSAADDAWLDMCDESVVHTPS